MTSSIKRKTIEDECTFEGIGLHYGNENKIICKPATEVQGIIFKKENKVIKVGTDQVVSTQRCTTLANDGIQVHTIEHILSALHALNITDISISLQGDEIPILDGSAKPFFESFKKVGLKEINGDVKPIVISKEMIFEDVDSGSKFEISPYDGFAVECSLDYKDPVVGAQAASLNSLDDFGQEISPARTFVLASELEKLFNANLIKGGRPDNALVFKDQNISNEGILELKNMLGIDTKVNLDSKIVNDLSLHFDNEPARHKLLDLLGDLYLLGVPIKGRIKAYRPGHTANLKLAKYLWETHISEQAKTNKAMYDANSPAIYNVTQIQELLPHRHPFLFVDKIIELTEEKVVGVKNVTINEPFFQGHFPGNPVFPGVLQMEALAQAGGILALTNSEEGQYDTYFVKMDNVKFKHMVFPGDTLFLEMKLLMPIRRGIVKMQGKAIVGDKVVSEGELVAKIIKRET